MAERFVFWGPLIFASVPLGWLSNRVAHMFSKQASIFVLESLAVLIMTAIYTPLVWLFVVWFEPGLVRQVGDPRSVILYVFGVVAMVAVVRGVILVWQAEEVGRGGADKRGVEPRLLQRLPSSRRAPVLRLSAMDHMVEVVTESGTEKLRIRLSDAVREMEPTQGYMAHRSHWVAKDAVVQAEKKGADKVYLKLSNGDLIPVSRTFRTDWADAGMLDRF
ncbi:MAG: LytTR family DNA-binding domain-containing protein [Pseudomonadota bacterium]